MGAYIRLHMWVGRYLLHAVMELDGIILESLNSIPCLYMPQWWKCKSIPIHITIAKWNISESFQTHKFNSNALVGNAVTHSQIKQRWVLHHTLYMDYTTTARLSSWSTSLGQAFPTYTALPTADSRINWQEFNLKIGCGATRGLSDRQATINLVASYVDTLD